MKAFLMILIAAAVCFSIVTGDNLKLNLELLKKSPLSGATLSHLHAHTNLVARSVEPRQDVFGTCTSEELVDLLRAIPQDCNNDIAAITGGDLSGLFDDLLNQNPATLTAVYRVFCQPRCGNPFVQTFLSCSLNPMADAARYLCSTNAAGSQCFELFDPLLADANRAAPSCSGSTFSCFSSCSSALTTLRDNSGCCVNFLNNSVVFVTQSSVVSTLEFELWERCNVNTPGFCNLETSSISSAVAVLLSKILFVGLLFAAFVFML